MGAARNASEASSGKRRGEVEEAARGEGEEGGRPHRHRAWQSLLRIGEAAGMASIATKAALHPIDTVKIRLQSQPFATRRDFWRSWRGAWSVRGLYSGLGIKMALYSPYQAAYMAAYTGAKDAFLLRRDAAAALDDFGTRAASMPALDPAAAAEQRRAPAMQLSLPEVLACAAAAELGSAAIRVPMEVIKIRVQCRQCANTLDAVRDLVSGGRGRGRHVAKLARAQTLLYDLPYSCVQWLCYERASPRVKQRLLAFESRFGSRFDRVVRDNFAPLASGGFSGCVAAAVTNPVDVIRTRVHLSARHGPGADAPIADTVRSMVREEGPRCFARGLGMRLVWVGSNMAVYFTIFEWLKRQGWH